jgi:hypothetical protein
MVEIAIGRGRKLKSPEANVVQSLVVDTEGLIRVFNELVDREGGVVRLF